MSKNRVKFLGGGMACAALVCFLLVGCGSNENKAVVPFGNTDIPKDDYSTLISELSEAGFENIETETITTTLEDKVGSVNKVTINGKGLFTRLTAYEKDVPVVITYYILQEPETAEVAGDAEAETETEAEATEDTKTFGDVYLMIGTAMSMSFGDNYDMSYDDSGITINMWQDGLAALAVLAQNGDTDAQTEWDNTVAGLKDMTVQTKESAMDKYGYGDKILVVNVLNDATKENTILTVSDGIVFYDVVNGVNLLGVE